MPRNPTCKACPCRGGTHTVCMWGRGNPKALLWLIDGQPDTDSDYIGEPHRGKAGKLLSHLLRELNLDEEKDVYIDYVVRCSGTLPTQKDGQQEAVDICSHLYLSRLLAVHHPRYIVGLGSVPLLWFCGLSRISCHEGSAVHDTKRNLSFMPSYSPAYILNRPSDEYKLFRCIASAAYACGHPRRPDGPIAPFPYDTRRRE